MKNNTPNLWKRSFLFLFLFLCLFIIGSCSFILQIDGGDILSALKTLSIPIVSTIILGLYVFDILPNVRKLSIEKAKETYSFRGDSKIKNLQVAGACYGTFLGIGGILAMLIFIFGLDQYIKYFMFIYFSLGLIVVFLVFWPIYKKHLKI
jgi:hypothetical protein